MPRGWRGRAFRPEEVSAIEEFKNREVLAEHDAETINAHKAQKSIRKQVNRVRYDRYVASLDGLLIRARPPEEDRTFRGDRDPRMRKSQATGPGRTGSRRVVTSDAGGRFTTSYQRSGALVRKAAVYGGQRTS